MELIITTGSATIPMATTYWREISSASCLHRSKMADVKELIDIRPNGSVYTLVILTRQKLCSWAGLLHSVKALK